MSSVKYDNLAKDLTKISQQMSADNLNFGLVGHIGGSPKEIGEFFSEYFGCELCHLPSINREKRNKTLASIVNKVYPFLPEQILKIIADKYKEIYQSSERTPPEDFECDLLSKKEKDSPILLIDDNALTGQTFEIWKEKIKETTTSPIYTFALTVTGNYFPDYFCFEGWRCFEWRPIGI